jgi:hypothetical protein
MKPEDIAKTSEHSHQAALFAWAAQTEIKEKYPQLKYMFAIPNGGFRNKREAANLRAEGVKSGILDIFLPVPKSEWCGLFIEMKEAKRRKHKNGGLTDEQIEFKKALLDLGYGVAVCYDWTEARDIIIQYMEQDGN